jgi:hypothetical protein
MGGQNIVAMNEIAKTVSFLLPADAGYIIGQIFGLMVAHPLGLRKWR